MINFGNRLKVLMIGPDKDAKGGIASVVAQYFNSELNKKVNLKYITTFKNANIVCKLIIAIIAYIHFCIIIKNYDIVHIHVASRNSFIRKSLFVKKAKKCNKRIIIHIHSGEFEKYFMDESSCSRKKYISYILNLCDKVITLSQGSKFFLQKIISQDKITVLYNGVNIPNYKKHTFNDFNVLFAGKLNNNKDPYVVIKAAKTVIKEMPNVYFYLAGEGDIIGCIKLVNENSLNNNVKILGWQNRNEIVDLYKKCSIYVLPSHYEGMPMSILEAMSYGLVVVASNVGGISEIISDGINGFLISPGDVNQLSKSILDVYKYVNMGKVSNEAYMTVKNVFSIDIIIKELLSIYYEML